jgi:hypothetical protein
MRADWPIAAMLLSTLPAMDALLLCTSPTFGAYRSMIACAGRQKAEITQITIPVKQCFLISLSLQSS